MEKESRENDQPPGSNKSVIDRLIKIGGNIEEINKAKRKYPMKISPYYLGLIKEKDDPIWKQCVADKQELEDKENVEDPLKEEEYTPVPYLVHKYPDRVLLLVSSKCAMYCRFCTRKRKVGRIQQIPLEAIFNAIKYIEEHTEVRDVIVSGGDPLMLSDNELSQILTKLRAIPHLQIIRIGTRIPCVLPARITSRLVNMLKKFHPVFMNIHFNHPSEITEDSSKACKLLADAGIPLGCQTVLLKGINDSTEVMKELMIKLLAIRVKPYYIYQCDLVKGVEHFRTPIETGIEMMKHLQGFTSGLSLPHFVIDGPGGKVPISPQYIKDITPDQIIITNYLGNIYKYPTVRGEAMRQLLNKKIAKIGIAYNLKQEPNKDEPYDRYAEFDDIETIKAIEGALEKAGYEVELLEANQNFFEKVKNSNVDFIFNIAEGIVGESRESHVPAILEMLHIPYSGSGVLTQAITLNKSRNKEILNYYGIPTPKFQVFRSVHQKLNSDMKFPLIVKPDAEGSSVGITNKSLVENLDELKKQVSLILKKYQQIALVEEYLTGREFTVSLIGNKKPRVLPIAEINFNHLPNDLHKFESYESKWIFDNPNNDVDPLIIPADVKPKLKAQLEKLARSTFITLGCVDFARIDMRLDAKGVPNVIDVNAIPGLMPDPKKNSRLPRTCYASGMTYDEIILEILNAALMRYNLLLPKPRKNHKITEMPANSLDPI